MSDNILIHNLEYISGERLEQLVPEMLKKHLNVNDVRFVQIHKNSVRGTINPRPVTITGKLVDPVKKKTKLYRSRKQRSRVHAYLSSSLPKSQLP